MMELFLFLHLLTTNHVLFSEKIKITNHPIRSTVKIYSNLAEIIQPVNQLPLEFSAEEWAEIRSDSLTLIGTNLTISQQTITEKKKSLNHQAIYVRSPSSFDNQMKFLRATMINEKQNLVKLIDPNISQDEIYLTIPSKDIIYQSEPSQLKYYVNFTYQSNDQFIHVIYLHSDLNWKIHYRFNL